MYLNDKDIQIIRFNKKLNFKFYSSYEIIEAIRTQTYWLKLSAIVNKIYLIFHIFKFKSYAHQSDKDELQLNSIIVENNKEWEIEKILNS